MPRAADAGGRLRKHWVKLTSAQRRRIVFGSLFAFSLAARDLMLLTVTGAMFALSELAPRPALVANPS